MRIVMEQPVVQILEGVARIVEINNAEEEKGFI